MLPPETIKALRACKIPVATEGTHISTFGFGDMLGTHAIITITADSEDLTVDEIGILRLQLEWEARHYNPNVLQKPLAMVQGHNTELFRKSDNGWQYRRASWTVGPQWMPVEPIPDLMVLLDTEVHKHLPKDWQAFK